MNRRNFFKGAAVVAAGAIQLEPTKPPVGARDVNTVRAGELLCLGVKRVSCNGVWMDQVSAFNVAEGWLETVEINTKADRFDSTRHFGKIGYEMES